MRTRTFLTHLASVFVGVLCGATFVGADWLKADAVGAIRKPEQTSDERHERMAIAALTTRNQILPEESSTWGNQIQTYQHTDVYNSPASTQNEHDTYSGAISHSSQANVPPPSEYVMTDTNSSPPPLAGTANEDATQSQSAKTADEANGPAHAEYVAELISALPEPKSSDYGNFEMLRAKLYDPSFEQDFELNEFIRTDEFTNLNPRHAIALTDEISNLINSGKFLPPRMFRPATGVNSIPGAH